MIILNFSFCLAASDNTGLTETTPMSADLTPDSFRSPVRRVVGAVFALIAALTALPVAGETLNAALTRAYENNPAIQAAVASVKVSAEGFPQARAGYLPSIQIQGQQQAYKEDSATTYQQASGQSSQIVKTTGSESLLMVNVSQTLYDGGKTSASMDIARSQASAALAQLDSTVAQIFQSLSSEYVNIQRANALIALNEDILKQFRLLEAQAQSLFSKRLGTLTDVAQAQTWIANAAAQRTSLKAALQASRSKYAALSGRTPDGSGAWPTLPALPATLDDAKRLAEQLNPSLRQARFGVEGARAEITAAKSGFLPNAQLGVQWYKEFNPTENTFNNQDISESSSTDELVVWLTVNVPLFSGGAVRSQVRQAHENFNSTTFTVADIQNQIFSSLEAGWAQWQSANEREQLVGLEVEAARQTLEGFTRQFRNGLSTMKDVIDSRQNLDSALEQQISARADILTAHLNLLTNIGQLTPHDFGLTVKSNGAEVYVQAVRDSLFGPDLP